MSKMRASGSPWRSSGFFRPWNRRSFFAGVWVNLSSRTFQHAFCQESPLWLKIVLARGLAERLKMFHCELRLISRQNERALQRVMQFPHISCPLQSLEKGQCALRKMSRRHGNLLRQLREKMPGERAQILDALPQRRHRNREDRQTVVQVLTKLFRSHQLKQSNIR